MVLPQTLCLRLTAALCTGDNLYLYLITWDARFWIVKSSIFLITHLLSVLPTFFLQYWLFCMETKLIILKIMKYLKLGYTTNSQIPNLSILYVKKSYIPKKLVIFVQDIYIFSFFILKNPLSFFIIPFR